MGAGARSLVVHGHFYQPPREDPWSNEIEREPGAAPFHDWNERIERECYRAVVAARRHGPGGRIADIVNLLASMSFDFGPTLLEWLERRAPHTYAAMLEADRASRVRCAGHGNAMAAPYHHVILPLASRRDKITEVRWGIADFRRRFGRDPAGMWLPETALDAESLDVLAAEGIAFTVVAPHQLQEFPPRGLPGRYRTSGGRSIALFAYDGDLSHGVAFGGLLKDADAWSRSVATRPAMLVSVATDGETYGHHHPFGELALAHLFASLGRGSDLRIENFASFLAREPAAIDVTLNEPSSWSCPHGVGRWRADCGCRLAPEVASQQTWRTPLREGLEWLAGELHALYEREAAGLLDEPWSARDGYGAELHADEATRDRFVASRARRPGVEAAVRVRELLELERYALGMFTSCGWFFDDIAGIETVQILKYAARAIELAGAEHQARLERGLLEHLARARGNTPGAPTGRDVYLRMAKPQIAPAARAAAGHAALHRLAPDLDPDEGSGYRTRESGGRLVVAHTRTGREDTFRVTVTSGAAHRDAQLVMDVAADGDGTSLRLGLDDLFDRQKAAATARLRRTLAERALSIAQVAPLAAGISDLRHVAAAALERLVSALGHDRSEAALAAIMDLADLVELETGRVPFDVQTAFFRVRASLGPEAGALLAPVAWRLGFADEAATASGGSGAGSGP